MAKFMTVQDWIPEHPDPEPVFLLTPFKPGIKGLSVKFRKYVWGFWENVSNSKNSQSQANSHSQPISESETIKNNSTKQEKEPKKKCAHLGK